MAIRFTSNDHTAQRITGTDISVSSTWRTRLKVDAATDGNHFTICLVWFCEEPGTAAAAGTIFEVNNTATDTAHSIQYSTTGSAWSMVWDCGSVNAATTVNLSSNPYNKWVFAFFAFEAVAGGARKCHSVAIVDGESPTSNLNVDWSGTCVSVTQVALQQFRSRLSGANRGCRGIPMIALRQDLVVDGNATPSGNTTVNPVPFAVKTNLTGVISSSMASPPTGLGASRFALNFFGGAKFLNGGTDGRTGRTITVATQIHNSDNASTNNAAYVTRAAGNGTITGTVVSVNPYLYGGASFPRPSTVVDSEGAPATMIGASPIGAPKSNTRIIAAAIKSGTVPKTVRVALSANSRAVYQSDFPTIRLVDGTFTGRQMSNNFNEMGWFGNTQIYNRGTITGYGNMPPPCRQPGVASGASEATGTNSAEYLFGSNCDTNIVCNNYTAGPDSGGTSAVASDIWTATSRKVDTSYSRIWCTSRTSSTVNGSTNRYRGNGNPRMVLPGYSYRIMVQPETGMPVTEGLTVGFYVANLPTQSNIWYRKCVSAGQSSADELADSWTTLSTYAAGTSKTIAAYTAPTFSSDTVVSARGTIQVDDTDNGFASLQVGDLIEFTTSLGVTKDEVVQVYSLGTPGSATRTITFDGLCKTAPTATSDKVVIKPLGTTKFFRKVEVTFTANEVASGKWRGIEIRAGGSGNGVMVTGLYFNNTSRPGIIPIHWGRSGCGYDYQNARYFTVTHAGNGVSMYGDMVANLNIDVAIVATADQGATGTAYHTAYRNQIALIKAADKDIEFVLAATGPEFTNEGSSIWTEQSSSSPYGYPKTNQAAAMQYVGASDRVPIVSYWYDPSRGDIWSRLVAGYEASIDVTHPTCELDNFAWMNQINRLSASQTQSRVRKVRSRTR